jgi:hypothetical protein
MRRDPISLASFADPIIMASALCVAIIVITRWVTIRHPERPAHRTWALAPASMLWQGLSSGDLCRRLKNPALNGKRSAQALVEHMENDQLVRWGWNPGEGRQPVPIPHKEFVNLMKIWVAGGSACPNS